MRAWHLVLFIAIAMLAISSVSEGQTQTVGEGQGVKWVPNEGEVPENALRVRVGEGYNLCRGMYAEEVGRKDYWRDMGVVKRDGRCHTLRIKPKLRHQNDFYYLVPDDTDDTSTEGMVSEDDVEERIAEAVAEAMEGMRSEDDVEERIAAAVDQEKRRYMADIARMAKLRDRAEDRIRSLEQEAAENMEGMISEDEVEARVEQAVAEATEGMVPESEVQARIDAATADLIKIDTWDMDMSNKTEGMISEDEVQERIDAAVAEATAGLISESDVIAKITELTEEWSREKDAAVAAAIEGLVSEDEVQARIDAAVAAATAGLVPESEVEERVDAAAAGATDGLIPETEVQARIDAAVAEAKAGMISESEVIAKIAELEEQWSQAKDEAVVAATAGLVPESEVQARIAEAATEAKAGMIPESEVIAKIAELTEEWSQEKDAAVAAAIEDLLTQEEAQELIDAAVAAERGKYAGRVVACGPGGTMSLPECNINLGRNCTKNGKVWENGVCFEPE